MLNKPIEFWFVLAGMILYTATRDAEKQPIMKRTAKTLASAALALGLAPDAAQWFGVSENIALVGIMAFGMMLLDVGTALISDRAFIKDLIRNRLGGSNNEQP